ncbi:3-hydroxyacyl-CoA dehydrogenase NAD-binding domain-containing protein [Usitatibacter palustris]|uniref:enoyl-CoA hydratase n=1 Tax=Usitatibacter palustris TaxID=2732487 RepID=A0A6M4H321_9PROT|nr:3-hydroxyacyl-CoA dehydrogenase NAD-binding domain-containing protein [Usitatibacter palustris]QJR13926.1 Fatty acid oxidation complex subunit alpha [Usitatibacter palustris]
MELKHWKLSVDSDNLAWLYFDRADGTTNTFSSEALRELGQVCAHLTTMPPKGLAILSAKDNGFAAGADIDEFTRLKDAEEAWTFIKLGNEIFDQVAALPFPTVAMIHGFCMGGGLELSLACRYRVADDGAKTKLGLPEVMIGIVPGWGGAKRLPLLIGPAQALDLMLTGRAIDGKRAKKMGVVDVATPRRHFENAARMLLKAPPAVHRPKLMEAMTNWPGIRSVVASQAAKKVAERARRDHYPAPYAIIETWRDFGGDPRNVPRDHPASMVSLFHHPTARNLIRIFKLQDRMKALGKADAEPIRHLHVIGAGVMGGDIAAWAALRGITVTLQDLAPERIAPAIKRAAELYTKRLKLPHLVQAAMDRLIPDVAGHGVAKADIVLEAIVENAEVKRKLFAQIEPRMKEDAILASNTSSIPLQELTSVLKRPERLVGLHFFNPVAQMMLVEIVQGPQTAASVMLAGQAFAKQIDKLPLPCKSAPGFLVNRVLSPYLAEAMLMVDEGIPPETVDAAAKDFGMPMGPIELADMVGLDVGWAVGQELAKPDNPIPQKLKQLVEAKKFGKKTGEGFYKWVKGKPQKSSTGPGTLDLKALADRMVIPALNEAVACVREKIVADADLCDAGVIFGTGFAPHRGGPINTIHARGKSELLAIMGELKAKYGPRFTPDAGWEQI